MRSTDTHIIARARSVIPLIGRSGLRLEGLIISLFISISLSAGNNSADSVMLAAYQNEDMTVWKEYVDSFTFHLSPFTFQLSPFTLLYLYGYCGYIVAEAKKTDDEALMMQAKHYVALFKSQITNHKSQLPAGHYEMYLSAVYVYELRLHESIHPVKAMSLAKQATKLAPNDPIVLAYYGTCLYYAPAPFGSKKDALTWFERADQLFNKPEYQFCWVRLATNMYIRLCR